MKTSGTAKLGQIHQDAPIAVRISEKIVAAISSGHFPVGEKLPSEMELSRHFGVSRPTIREALNALQFAGYIDSVRGSGKRVIAQQAEQVFAAQPDLNVPDVLDLLQARMIMEPQVVALAALDPDPKAFKVAESLIHGMSLVVHEPSINATTDIRVHIAIARVCRNSFMTEGAIRLLQLAGAPVLRQARIRAWSDHHLKDEWADHHGSVLTAIQRRDASAAALASRQHLTSVIRNVLDALEDTSPQEREAIARMRTFIDG